MDFIQHLVKSKIGAHAAKLKVPPPEYALTIQYGQRTTETTKVTDRSRAIILAHTLVAHTLVAHTLVAHTLVAHALALRASRTRARQLTSRQFKPYDVQMCVRSIGRRCSSTMALRATPPAIPSAVKSRGGWSGGAVVAMWRSNVVTL